MSMTAPGLEMAMPWEAQEVDRWLREGHPTLGWRGDPRLSLHIGLVKTMKAGIDPKTNRYQRVGDVIAWNWQVFRHNEDGTDTMLLQRKGDKLVEIIPKLVEMDPRTPGHENVMDVVDREQAKVHADKSYAIQQAIGEQREHLWKLVGDRQNGKTTFRGMPGSNPDKQA